jgi:hypothetical protein
MVAAAGMWLMSKEEANNLKNVANACLSRNMLACRYR